MDRSRFRKRKSINYYEADEPPFDKYIYCERCYDFVYEYCAVHGPLLVIPDDKVTSRAGIPPWVPRAALTTPTQFLHIAPSIIPDAGLGVFSTLTLPRGVRFGPYRGKRTDGINSMYCWQIRTNKSYTVVDGMDGESSNWMRYVNCARSWEEQNLVAFQFQGHIYYRTVKIIPKFTELLVFYGCRFAKALGIDLKNYNSSQKIIVGKYIIEDNSPKQAELDKNTQLVPSTETIEICEETSICNIEIKQEVNKELIVTNEQTSIKLYINLDTRTTNINNQNSISTPKKDSKQICNICNKMVHYHNLKRHTLTHENKSLFCSQCSYKTNFKYYFNNHMKNHKRDEIYECNICTYVTYNKKYFRRHYKNAHKIVLSVYDNLNRYNKNVVNESFHFNCTKCNFKTNFDNCFFDHLEAHKSDLYKCDLCSYSSTVRNNFVSHLKVHDKDQQINNKLRKIDSYRCDLCSYTSTVRRNFLKHISRLHNKCQKNKCIKNSLSVSM